MMVDQVFVLILLLFFFVFFAAILVRQWVTVLFGKKDDPGSSENEILDDEM